MPLLIPTHELDRLSCIIAARPTGASVKKPLAPHELDFPKRTLQRRIDQLVSGKRIVPRGQGRARRYLPYPQPFEDVNKRVSRLTANIPLVV